MKNKDFMLLNQISQKTELSCLTQFKESCGGDWLISLTSQSCREDMDCLHSSCQSFSKFLWVWDLFCNGMIFLHWGWTFEYLKKHIHSGVRQNQRTDIKISFKTILKVRLSQRNCLRKPLDNPQCTNSSNQIKLISFVNLCVFYGTEENAFCVSRQTN